MPTDDRSDVFAQIFQKNVWASPESRSGSGSSIKQTQQIAAMLPDLLRDLNVRSLLDIPCGDFHWMRFVDLSGVDYTGADVVAEIVGANQQYAGPGRRFVQLDVINDGLPPSDLVLVRDCLVHLCDRDLEAALANLSRGAFSFLLTTTFPRREENSDIRTGDWRPLNLQAKPFCLPTPQMLVNEGCTEGDGGWADKSLGLWTYQQIVDWSRARDIH